MHIEDEDGAELKKWIVKKLENISDADSDVLADYVLALIRAELPETDLRASAIESLEDFLKDNTASFVDEVFRAILTKSYIPGYVPPLAVSSGSPPFSAPLGPTSAYGTLGAGRGSYGGFQESRKRSYNDRQESENGTDSQYARGGRPIKQGRFRAGRGGGQEGFGNRGGRGGYQEQGHPFSNTGSPPIPLGFPSMPMPPPGLSFDPNDPMSTILAMQAMGMPQMPGVPSLAHAGSPNGHPQFGVQTPPTLVRPRRKERCRDYDTRGICTRGGACPYEHDSDRVIVPGDEYDPKNSSLMGIEPTSPTSNEHGPPNGKRGNEYNRGQGRGRGDRGGFTPRRQNNRADFSQAGPNHDRSITTIVVEQIPEEKFDEGSVREFFSEFGSILEVTMQPYKRLALVKYDDYMAARGAYESPKVIFDNRFVKVYWYKPGTLPTPPSTGKPLATPSAEEPAFDKEEFERNAAVAQKKLEEKKAQLKNMDAKRQALEKQKEELAQKQAEEKRKLLEKLKAKGVSSDDTAMANTETNGTNGTDDSKVSAHTKALREKVAELEAEAKSLGLDSALSDYTPRGRGRGRGRGSYRGWEGFAGRGAGYDSSRGRGRGAFGTRGGGKYNLDNRTKKVGVSGIEFTPERDEALRQHLLGIGEFEAIEILTEKPDTQIITFKDRAIAESFMYGSKDLPSVGKVELTWYNAPSISTPTSAKPVNPDGDVGMGGANADGDTGHAVSTEMDYDVAEEDDRWR